jgi:hypothetical protein
VRRSTFVATDGYDGDVMFENLELMRTVTAAGGTVVTPLDLYVRRLPPTSSHFVSQRVRQAYDDFALPARMTAFLSVLPALVAALAARRWGCIAVGAAAVAGAAEVGRRRAGGARRFPATSSLLAPAWVLERGVSAWLALRRRLTGGVSYSGRTIRRSATPPRELRLRLGAVGLAGAEAADSLVSPVAERRDPGAPAATESDRATA